MSLLLIRLDLNSCKASIMTITISYSILYKSNDDNQLLLAKSKHFASMSVVSLSVCTLQGTFSEQPSPLFCKYILTIGITHLKICKRGCGSGSLDFDKCFYCLFELQYKDTKQKTSTGTSVSIKRHLRKFKICTY